MEDTSTTATIMSTDRISRSEQDGLHIRGLLICCCLSAGSCFLALLTFWFAWHLQYEFSNWPARQPASAYRFSPLLLTWHAEQLSARGNLVQAQRIYRQALQQNPLYPPAWLGLAAVEDDRGKRTEANQLLNFIAMQTRDIQRWAWNKTLLAYRLGRRDILAGELPYIIGNIPGKPKNDAMRMAFTLWPSLPELREHLGEHLIELFRYAIRSGQQQRAIMLWPELSSHLEAVPKEEIFRFITQLIAQKEWPIAKEAWALATHFRSGLVYDSYFRHPPLQGAFGWRISEAKGCVWSIEPDGRSAQESNALHLHFTGQENVQYQHVAQIIPIDGGRKYRLSGLWKGKTLTTDQRPYLEFSSYACTGVSVRSEMIERDTEDWQNLQVDLEIPSDCQAVILRLRRQQSLQIDSRLRGDFWITGLQLTEPAD